MAICLSYGLSACQGSLAAWQTKAARQAAHLAFCPAVAAVAAGALVHLVDAAPAGVVAAVEVGLPLVVGGRGEGPGQRGQCRFAHCGNNMQHAFIQVKEMPCDGVASSEHYFRAQSPID